MIAAIIDEYFSPEMIHKYFPNVNLCVHHVGNIRIKQDGEADMRYSHGTVCAMAFLERSEHVQLICISMLDAFDAHAFFQAAVLCQENDVDIVLCCFGTTNGLSIPFLRQGLDILHRHHMQVVAACSNRNIVTFPASMHNVFGVKSIGIAPRQWCYWYDQKAHDGIEVSVRLSSLVVVERLNREQELSIPYSNSIAAAFIMGEYVKQVRMGNTLSIFDHYQNHPQREEIRDYMFKCERHAPQEPIIVQINNADLANSMQKSLQALGYIAVTCNYRNDTCVEQFCIGVKTFRQFKHECTSLFDTDFFLYQLANEVPMILEPDLTITQICGQCYCDCGAEVLLTASTVDELALKIIKKYTSDKDAQI